MSGYSAIVHILAIASIVGVCANVVAVETGAPVLVPAPREMVVHEGVCKTGGSPRLEYIAGIPVEGYELSVTADGVTIRCSDAVGEFYARMTLSQLLRKEAGESVYPCCEIKDAPRYRWRGVHIDDCRHFFGKEKVKRVMDLMAQHKLNRLHWHLTDDQGWRLDVPGYPELARVGSVREASGRHGTRPHVKNAGYAALLNGEKYGPFYYTESDVREIVAYAAERHIAIVPEIELPGHVYAALAAYPQFSCFPERLKGMGPLCAWGVANDVLCVGNEQAVKFMEDVLDYVCRVFPGDVVHIGGDECPDVNWRACPKCQARMEAEGLTDARDLQPWITRRMLAFLAARGRRGIGWDEYLSGDVPTNAMGMVWRTEAREGAAKYLSPAECVARGHDLVMATKWFCYFDYKQGLEDDPFQYFGRCVTLEKAYSFDPCEGIAPELRGHILGGQCNNWSEYTWNEYDLDWKMWPRTCALAEVLWTGEERPGFADFKRRMVAHRRRLLSMGVNCAPLE